MFPLPNQQKTEAHKSAGPEGFTLQEQEQPQDLMVPSQVPLDLARTRESTRGRTACCQDPGEHTGTTQPAARNQESTRGPQPAAGDHDPPDAA